jgi:hypothetical protein
VESTHSPVLSADGRSKALNPTQLPSVNQPAGVTLTPTCAHFADVAAISRENQQAIAAVIGNDSVVGQRPDPHQLLEFSRTGAFASRSEQELSSLVVESNFTRRHVRNRDPAVAQAQYADHIAQFIHRVGFDGADVNERARFDSPLFALGPQRLVTVYDGDGLSLDLHGEDGRE